MFPKIAQPISICTLDSSSHLPAPLSRSLIPGPGILHAPLPTDPRQENALDDGHQPQRRRDARPQTVQLPPQPERGAHADRHRHRVVAEQLHVPPDLLPAQAAQDAVAAGGEGVEELEGGAQREGLGDQADDLWIVGEELGDVVPQRREQDHVEQADGDGGEPGHSGTDLPGVGERCADQVGDASGCGDGDGEGDSGWECHCQYCRVQKGKGVGGALEICSRRDPPKKNMIKNGQDLVRVSKCRLQEYVLECDACECGEDGLSGEMAGAEIGCGEGQDFKGEVFRFDHDEAGDGEADHWEPVV